jgi:inosine/xanthosine triphosphate pyrophosphatase family protein
MAELGPEVKNQISHRALALKLFREKLKELV